MEDKIEQKNNLLRKCNYVKNEKGLAHRLTSRNIYEYNTARLGLDFFGIKLNRKILSGIDKSNPNNSNFKKIYYYITVKDGELVWGYTVLTYLHEIQNLYERVYGEELYIDYYEIKDGIN